MCSKQTQPMREKIHRAIELIVQLTMVCKTNLMFPPNRVQIATVTVAAITGVLLWIVGNTFMETMPDLIKQKNFHTERQNEPITFLENDGVPIDIFVALAANLNADCWIHVRTFAENGEPFPSTAGQGNGPLVSLTQRGDLPGNRFLFQFGTDTGNIFNRINFAPNAICLPLRCSNFTIATLEARNDAPLGSPNLLPINSLEGMFSKSCSVPLDIGTVFTWNEVFFPSNSTNTPIPFYQDFNTCLANAQEVNPNRGDFFSFNIHPEINAPLSNESCFIKIQIRDCFDENLVTVASIDPRTAAIDSIVNFTVQHPLDIIGSTTVGFADNIITTATMPTTSTVTTCDETTSTLRVACLPFVCGDIIQILVRSNPENGHTNFCQITGRSNIVDTEIISDITNNSVLILSSNGLKASDYNDPNLGLYFDSGSSLIAEARCNAGTGNETSDTLNLESGVATIFNCAQTEQNMDALNLSSSKTPVCSRVAMTEREFTSSDRNNGTITVQSNSVDMIQALLSLVVTASVRSFLESSDDLTFSVAITSRVLPSPPDTDKTIVPVSLSVVGFVILVITVIVLVLFCVLQTRKKRDRSSSAHGLQTIELDVTIQNPINSPTYEVIPGYEDSLPNSIMVLKSNVAYMTTPTDSNFIIEDNSAYNMTASNDGVNFTLENNIAYAALNPSLRTE